MAQSVPTATWVPCLRSALPLGLELPPPGRARHRLPSSRWTPTGTGRRRSRSGSRSPATPRARPRSPATGRAWTASSASRRPPRRFEGERYYVFDGGCITFEFTLTGDSDRGEALALATQAVGAVDPGRPERPGARRERRPALPGPGRGRVSHDRHRDARRRQTAHDRCGAGCSARSCPSSLLAAVFFWFLPQFTSIADVWTSVKSMTWAEVAILLLAAIWNLATYQFVVVSTMPGHELRGRPPSTPRRRRRCPTRCSAGRRSPSASPTR